MNEEGNLEEMKRMEQMKKLVLNKILSRSAIERMGRLKLVKPELASQLELYLVQLYQSGKITSEIDDNQLKSILGTLSSKREFKILK